MKHYMYSPTNFTSGGDDEVKQREPLTVGDESTLRLGYSSSKSSVIIAINGAAFCACAGHLYSAEHLLPQNSTIFRKPSKRC